MPILDLAYGSSRSDPPDHRRLYVVAPSLPAELEGENVTLVRGEPYRATCAKTLWTRGLRFDLIRDENPDKTLANCLLVAKEFPRLLVAGSGILELRALPEAWIPHILMAFHEDIRHFARQTSSPRPTVVLDMSRSKNAWLDKIGHVALLPDPLARRALVAWLLAALAAKTKHPDDALVVVDLASREDKGHFTLCARTALAPGKVLVLEALPNSEMMPVNLLRIGSAHAWDLKARRAMHFDGVVICSDDNCTDMPCIKVTDTTVATQDLALLRTIVEIFPPEILGTCA